MRAAEALHACFAIGAVVVGQLFARPDVAQRSYPDAVAVDLAVAVRPAGVIDVAADVAAEGRIARPAPVDRETPDAAAREIALLAPVRFGRADLLACVLDDEGVFGNRRGRKDARATDAGRPFCDQRLLFYQYRTRPVSTCTKFDEG